MNKKSRIVLLVSVIIAVFIIAIVSYTNRRLTVVLDPPVVVAQNEDSYNNGTWGFFQFPKLIILMAILLYVKWRTIVILLKNTPVTIFTIFRRIKEQIGEKVTMFHMIVRF